MPCATSTQPYFEQKFIADSYANRAGKGTHRALDRATQFARRYKYVLQCDVVQFFPSLDHAILMQTLSKMLPDQSVNWMIERILASGQGVLTDEYNMVYFPGDTRFADWQPDLAVMGQLLTEPV